MSNKSEHIDITKIKDQQGLINLGVFFEELEYAAKVVKDGGTEDDAFEIILGNRWINITDAKKKQVMKRINFMNAVKH